MSGASDDDYKSYARRVGGAAVGDVAAAAVWREVTSIGGENGYFYLDWLWRLRELLDALAGGTGATRARRTARADALQCGDRIDSWEVIGVEPGRRLALRFGMKAPGAGVLEFRVEPLAPARTRVTATAYWQPAGASGLLYWWSLAPAHLVIFDGLTREILRRAARQNLQPMPSVADQGS
jgi:hypothetical protein